ncbi:hypothetical protein F511_20308 [Dorcoceras hygrometricum]|uniref:Uncharacterized protein n=1 Tax=Dorcoceras hygrometricum TaxID=472368 RepID=A0A2Z7B8X1_9LAMI|nr:hypothetical protein F511_20308 [Dorcoceras hygrometricum]
MVKRLATSPHYPIGITDSACKNQSIMDRALATLPKAIAGGKEAGARSYNWYQSEDRASVALPSAIDFGKAASAQSYNWYQSQGHGATGEHSQTFQNALKDVLKLNDDVPNQIQFGDADACNTSLGDDDSISETHTPSSKPNVATTSKKRKRKQLNEMDDAIVTAINNLADITKVTMNDLVKQLAAPHILSDAQDVVLEALRGMSELSEDEQVIAAQLLFNNHNSLALFKRLNARGKLSLVKRLLRGD